MNPLTGDQRWCQACMNAELEERFATLFAIFSNEGQLEPIGNGFIVSYDGDKAIGITAKHNVDAIRKAQGQSKMAPHVSVSPLFRPPVGAVDIGTEHTKAAVFNANGIGIYDIGWFAECEGSDLAFCALIPQQKSGAPSFYGNLKISSQTPEVGEVVCVMAHKLSPMDSNAQGDREELKLGVQKILRAGTVTEVFQDGHLMTKGSGFRTTFPIEGGLSGAPILKYGGDGSDMVVYGVASQHAAFSVIDDFTVAGDTTVSGLAALQECKVTEDGYVIRHNNVIISNDIET